MKSSSDSSPRALAQLFAHLLCLSIARRALESETIKIANVHYLLQEKVSGDEMTAEQDQEEREEEWLQEEEEEHYPIDYNISASPNDFNVKTLFDFIASGILKLPGFQRNYVWDLKRASRLIESILMGLPIPQIFLYEKGRNDFLVIDGQQRLMTIYYFIEGRFPRMGKRAELRRIIDREGKVPEGTLADDIYFTNFELDLGTRYIDTPNRLEGLTEATLDPEDRTAFGLKTIRCIFIKQHAPTNDSIMYEIFYRLNTGGMNLTPQEIRASLYYSDFYSMLTAVNLDDRWRRLTKPEPDIRMRDMEILLRGFAMLQNGNNYRPPMARFLNSFSETAKSFEAEEIRYFRLLFEAFLARCARLPQGAFQLQTGRFSASVYEAIFTAACEKAFGQRNLDIPQIDPEKLDTLKKDRSFLEASRSQTTGKENVSLRLARSRELLLK